MNPETIRKILQGVVALSFATGAGLVYLGVTQPWAYVALLVVIGACAKQEVSISHQTGVISKFWLWMSIIVAVAAAAFTLLGLRFS